MDNTPCLRKALLSCFMIAVSAPAFSQTWADNVAPIFYSKCVTCHRPEGIAPFSLLTYTDAFAYKNSILTTVASKEMPPWPPADNYTHFMDARVLTSSQINTIVSWVNSGATAGNLNNAPPVPPPPTNALGTPDVTLRMPNYTSTAASGDVYQSFVLPLRLSADKYISACEVIPGNTAIVHHVLVFQDTTANHAAQQLDNASPGPGYLSFGGVGVNSALLLDAWVPGQSTKKLPSIFGKHLYPNSDLVIQVHYPAGTSGMMDSTKVKLYYNSNPAPREVRIEPVLNHNSSLVNGPLSIPANTVKTFESRFTVPGILKSSVLTVAPHMHLVGESIKCYANKPNNDTIRFIDIPHWDFHWQGQYYYQKPVIVDGGSTLRAFATYNNTSGNPENPNSPPQTVNLGEQTTDEMLLVYFAFAAYQPGDENIIIDSSTITTGTGDPQVPVRQLTILNNPAQDYIQFLNPEQHKPTQLAIWDMAGRKMYEAELKEEYFVQVPVKSWAAGVYSVYLKTKDAVYKGKVLIRN